MELSLVKRSDNLFQLAYDSDFEKAQKIKPGDIYKCQITKPRGYGFHKKIWALYNMVFDNQELFNNVDDMRREITIEAGFYTTYHGLHGELIKQAKSISFGEMDAFEFQDLYEKTKDVICIHFRFTNELIEENIHRYY